MAYATVIVDENLFYKGVDKSAVHGARLHHTHAETAPGEAPQPVDSIQPPYPFTVCQLDILGDLGV